MLETSETEQLLAHISIKRRTSMLEASETEQLLAHIYTLYQRVEELNDRITKLTEIFQQYIKLCKTQSKT